MERFPITRDAEYCLFEKKKALAPTLVFLRPDGSTAARDIVWQLSQQPPKISHGFRTVMKLEGVVVHVFLAVGCSEERRVKAGFVLPYCEDSSEAKSELTQKPPRVEYTFFF